MDDVYQVRITYVLCGWWMTFGEDKKRDRWVRRMPPDATSTGSATASKLFLSIISAAPGPQLRFQTAQDTSEISEAPDPKLRPLLYAVRLA